MSQANFGKSFRIDDTPERKERHMKISNIDFPPHPIRT